MKEPLIQIRNLSKHFKIGKSTLYALCGLNLDLYKGETLGLVGESGCGKSTAGRTILRLYEPTSGEVFFEGRSISLLSKREMAPYRQKMQMVFQDPQGSLNPRMCVEEIVAEGMDIHSLAQGRRKERVQELLELVGLHPSYLQRYPHEFSGGQRQRIGLARALAVEPEFIVCDEPISALDVSIQSQVVNLFIRLQEELRLTYLFIAHDLSMVQYISHRVAVMYLGHLVELASSRELYSNPLHPYTQALLSVVPMPDPRRENKRNRILLKGEVPSPVHPTTGCVFQSRCPMAMPICREIAPDWKEIASGHWAACHLYR